MRIGNGVGVLVNDPIHRRCSPTTTGPTTRPRVFATHANAARLGGVFGPMVAGSSPVISAGGWPS